MLEEYQKKRNFSRTTEPTGEGGSPGNNGAPRFVIQKHDASRLHYDLRLEHDGVLLSWAVPKGPSLDPEDKRLAIRVEDHPLEYGNFEGIIPEGEYGGGTVMIWDYGTYDAGNDVRKSLDKGKLKLRLDGEKLEGAWELVRMRGKRSGDDDKEQWLFFKIDDEDADPERNILKKTQSVKTGRSMKEIAGEAEAGGEVWSSEETWKELLEEITDKTLKNLPAWENPSLATLVKSAPEGTEWLHEIKFDGYRLIAEVEGQSVRLLTRNRKDWTEKFPQIADAIGKIGVDCQLDGEVVVLDKDGRSRFGLLQRALSGDTRRPMRFMLFDLLTCNKRDLRKTRLEDRKRVLEALFQDYEARNKGQSVLRYSRHVEGDGPTFYEKACEKQLEGIISKKRGAHYIEGRSRNWLKTKCEARQEFLICGYTPPQGSRKHFGALLLAFHNDDGALCFAGKVGTGFDDKTLKEVHTQLKQRERKSCPLSEETSRSEAGDAQWITPDLVAEISFTEITDDHRLRHPVFHGLREDKNPENVHLEKTKEEQSEKPGNGSSSAKRNSRKGQEGHQVLGISVTNPDRKVYPDAGLTKFDVVDYYGRIGEKMLPYIENRPLSLVRCPRGREKKCFYQKHFRDAIPEHVKRIEVEEKEGREPYSYVTGPEGLVALAQWGVLEFHPWGSRTDRPDRPDVLIFDLDPSPDVSWQEVLGATFLVRDVLEELDLRSFVKTSGGKGLHVQLPIERYTGWDEARAFTKEVAEAVKRRNPDKFITTAGKSKRKGKIFIDYLRNGRGSTSVAPFSTRAREGAPISTPIGWHEVSPELSANQYTIENLFRRLSALSEDPWKDYFEVKQRLSKSLFEKVKSL